MIMTSLDNQEEVSSSVQERTTLLKKVMIRTALAGAAVVILYCIIRCPLDSPNCPYLPDIDSYVLVDMGSMAFAVRWDAGNGLTKFHLVMLCLMCCHFMFPPSSQVCLACVYPTEIVVRECMHWGS